ncbi:glycosyltransferase [Pelagibacterium lacus]|nr:glycosyltransferase [Pelagibacterium lacus]
MTAPRFSIVTVNLDNHAGLAATWHSLRDQSFGDFEWIVVDAVSRDGSIDFLHALGDSRLALICEPDRSLYDGMNKGLDRARGDFLLFLNSGDRLADAEVLRRMADWPRLGETDIAYGDATEIGPQNTMIKRAMPHWMVAYSMFTHHQAIFYRRAFIASTRYDLSFRRVADWALTATLLKRGAQARHIDLMVCHFARGGVSQAPDRIEDARAEMIRLHREVLGLPTALSRLLVAAKFAVNDFRRKWPGAYDFIRSRV